MGTFPESVHIAGIDIQTDWPIPVSSLISAHMKRSIYIAASQTDRRLHLGRIRDGYEMDTGSIWDG
jgi:hypothetical protein